MHQMSPPQCRAPSTGSPQAQVRGHVACAASSNCRPSCTRRAHCRGRADAKPAPAAAAGDAVVKKPIAAVGRLLAAGAALTGLGGVGRHQV